MTHHPDAETIAGYQAGALARWRLLRRRRAAAHLAGCPDCAATARRLTTVTAVLASASHPTMPAHVAERLTEVLAAQPAPSTRETTHGRSKRLLAAPGGRRPRLVPVGAVVVLLGILGVGGYFIGQTHGPSETTASSSRAQGNHQPGPEVTGSGFGMNPERIGAQDSGTGGRTSYRVVASGTNYLPATLRAQVGHEKGDTSLSGIGAPSALAGCIAKLATGSAVQFVDIAKYQGRRAWVIASAARAWVTETSCSASGTNLLATVTLASVS
jgi:hypothetical protein